MTRVLRSSVGVNFVGSVLLVLGWIGYAAWRGFPIDQHCLGFRHGPRILDGPAWVAPLLIEIVFLGLFCVRRYVNEMKIRFVIAGFSVWCLLFGVGMPLLRQQIYGIAFFSLDQALWWYACISNIAYGLVGSAPGD